MARMYATTEAPVPYAVDDFARAANVIDEHGRKEAVQAIEMGDIPLAIAQLQAINAIRGAVWKVQRAQAMTEHRQGRR